MAFEKNIPCNFSRPTGQELHHYFRNLCLEFKKTLHNTKDVETLQVEMDKIINACKDLKWKEPKHDIWKKTEGEKAILKLFAEFKRYIKDLRCEPEKVSSQYVLTALDEIIKLIESQKVT